MPKIAVLTGASGRLGPIWQETLEEEGIKVFPVDLPHYDISRRDLVKKAHLDCLRAVGVPDIILCNAGVDNPPGSKATLWEVPGHSTDDYIMGVNYYGHKWLIQEFEMELKYKKVDYARHIIFIGSLLGNVSADFRNYTPPFDKPVDYGASKGALRLLMLNLATRLAPYNILVNMLSFSAVESPLHDGAFVEKYLKNVPLNRMADKGDLQNALRGLLKQTYITGQEIKSFGGYDCL